LRFFPKGKQVWHDTKMFAAPIASGCAHAALHFVENEKDLVFVANFSQGVQPFAAKVIVAALALDRFNNDGADVDSALIDKVADLALGLLLALNHIGFALRLRQRKVEART
jgi:hypothetical protein